MFADLASLSNLRDASVYGILSCKTGAEVFRERRGNSRAHVRICERDPEIGFDACVAHAFVRGFASREVASRRCGREGGSRSREVPCERRVIFSAMHRTVIRSDIQRARVSKFAQSEHASCGVVNVDEVEPSRRVADDRLSVRDRVFLNDASGAIEAGEADHDRRPTVLG